MNRHEHSDNLFIADFTEYFKTHPESLYKGVVASEIKFDELDSFNVYNSNHCKFDFINFEENLSIFKQENGEVISQCECMCEAYRDKGKSWLALIELKYCQKKKIVVNMDDAISQVCSTYEHLTDRQIITPKNNNIYFIVSHPEHSIADVSSAFVLDQDECLEIKQKYNATLLYTNAIQVLTPKHLRNG